MSDIVCEDIEVVTVLCNRMDVKASDLVLDSPARRKPGGPTFRRALVHDERDGLTINFNRDYPGGVTVSGEVVTVACNRMDVTGSDIVLDSPVRRKPGGPRFRRALVHDERDGLTINFNRDYPGGVTVGGEVVTVACNRMDVTGSDIVLDSPVRRKPGGSTFRRALVHDENDGLSLNFANDYPGGVTVGDVRVLDVTGDLHFRIFHPDEAVETETVILGDVVKALRQQITDLQAQVTELAARP